MQLAIHCEPAIPWQQKRAAYFAEGFRNIGVRAQITASRSRIVEGPAVLLGTTCWREIERDGLDFLLVDRCSFGSTDHFVSLVWNGHGRRGVHCVPDGFSAARWERYGVPLGPWQSGARRVLCGQAETYSPRWATPQEWYSAVSATHFRPHPASGNTTGLPVATTWDDCGLAITLNSSVGVQSVMRGIPTVAMDEGSMAWEVAGHSQDEVRIPDREPWCHWLAWTQWSDDEIKEGIPWAYLLP